MKISKRLFLHSSKAFFTQNKHTIFERHYKYAWKNVVNTIKGNHALAIPITTRTYFTATYYDEQKKKKLLNELEELYDNVITSNWNDTFYLVLNIPLWEGTLSSLEEKLKGFEKDEELEKKKQQIQRTFDVLFILEDLRDHMNELLEQLSRSTGIAGTYILKSFKVENIDEHIEFLKKKYDQLLQEYPDFSYQIKNVLGTGLVQIRQKYHFEWDNMHEYFF